MRTTNSLPTNSPAIQLVALASMIVLVIVLLIPVVQATAEDTVSARVAKKTIQIETGFHRTSPTSASIEM